VSATPAEISEPSIAPDPSPGREPRPAGPGRAARVAALSALAVAGALLGVLPHLEALRLTGEPQYVADSDNLLYLAWSRDLVRRGTPRLADAVRRPSGPMMHPPLLFVPPGLAVHAMGLDLAGLGVVWRGLAGALLALGAFAGVRPAVRSFWVALGLAAALAFSSGLLSGSPIRRDAEVAFDVLARGGREYLRGTPRLMPQFRVPTPSLVIPLLMAHYALALRARRTGRGRDVAWAALSLGVLVHAYFYFWTALLPAGALAWLLDPKGRRAYAKVAAGGLLLGLPAILQGAAIKAGTPPDWLLRTEHFLPVARLTHVTIPRAEILLVAALAAWVVLRRRELTYLWCGAATALALANHQLLTGLEIENFHYFQAAGVSTSLLLVHVLASPLFGAPAGSDAAEPGPRTRRAASAALAALVAVQVPTAFWLRWTECRSAETVHFRALAAQLRRDLPRLPAGAVLAAEPDVQLYLAGTQDVYPLTSRLADYASGVTDAELDERAVLNAYLAGDGRERLLGRIAAPPGALLVDRHYAAGRPGFDAVRARRRDLVDAILADPGAWARRFGVTHVVRPAGDPGTNLRGLGHRVAGGEAWALWALDPPQSAAEGSAVGPPAPDPGAGAAPDAPSPAEGSSGDPMPPRP
jgi:hypothetical protein